MIRRLTTWLNTRAILVLMWLDDKMHGVKTRQCRGEPIERVSQESLGPLIETFRSDVFTQLLRHSAKCKSQACKNAIYTEVFCAGLARNSGNKLCEIAEPIYDRWCRLEDARDFDEAMKIMYPDPRS